MAAWSKADSIREAAITPITNQRGTSIGAGIKAVRSCPTRNTRRAGTIRAASITAVRMIRPGSITRERTMAAPGSTTAVDLAETAAVAICFELAWSPQQGSGCERLSSIVLVTPVEETADGAFENPVVICGGGTDANAEVDLPLGTDVLVNGGEDMPFWNYCSRD